MAGAGLMPEAESSARGALLSTALRRAGRWTWLGGAAVLGLIAIVAALKGQPKAQPRPAEEARVLAADEALAAAMRSGDKAGARKLLALQFSLIDADGKLHTRRDFLSDLKGVAGGAPTDAEVRRFGLIATVTGHRYTALAGEVFFLDIWAKQKGTWRMLVMQEVALGVADASATAASAQGQPCECKNPCQVLPYRVRSAAEQDIINTFQAIERAVVAHDGAEWSKHVADDFVRYDSGAAPVAKAARIAMIERQKESNAAVKVGEVQKMQLSVYGDGAAMVASQVIADRSDPPYYAVRVWARRGGQWQMAVSAHTHVK
jgi:Domain of unknown function (DUF4440)